MKEEITYYNELEICEYCNRPKVHWMWYIIGILFPLMGYIGAIIGAIQKKKGTGTLALSTLVASLLWFIFSLYRNM